MLKLIKIPVKMPINQAEMEEVLSQFLEACKEKQLSISEAINLLDWFKTRLQESKDKVLLEVVINQEG